MESRSTFVNCSNFYEQNSKGLCGLKTIYIPSPRFKLGKLPKWLLMLNQFKSVLQTNPLMIRVDTKSGHGAGKPTSKSIEEYTDLFCFLVKSIGIQYRK